MKKKASIYVCPMKKRRIVKELYYNRAPVACMYVCSMKKKDLSMSCITVELLYRGAQS